MIAMQKAVLLVFYYSIFCLSLPFVHAQEITVLMNKGDALWLVCTDPDRVSKAIASYEKVLELDPDNYEALWKIARSYFVMGDSLPETKEFKDRHKQSVKRACLMPVEHWKLTRRELKGTTTTVCQSPSTQSASVLLRPWLRD